MRQRKKQQGSQDSRESHEQAAPESRDVSAAAFTETTQASTAQERTTDGTIKQRPRRRPREESSEESRGTPESGSAWVAGKASRKAGAALSQTPSTGHVSVAGSVIIPSPLVARFAAEEPFPLDPFQIEAANHFADEKSVLVAAPTGTGKTVVAEFAIWLMRQRGLRAIYTAPIKALSNQKFRDLRARYGADTVGLLTGDIVENPAAPVLVMTTEIYRNMLLEGSRVAQEIPFDTMEPYSWRGQ